MNKKGTSSTNGISPNEGRKDSRPSRSRTRPSDVPVPPIRHNTTELMNALSNVHVAPTANVTTVLEPTFDCFIQTFSEIGFKKIITMVGAGISTSAGIPDFRSPDKGIYANMLDKYELPHPQAIFEIDYFMQNPGVFYDLAKQLMPSQRRPTKSHYFIKFLMLKGLLLRHYTQNIDGLERIAGIREDKLVEAHGTFQTGHCMQCHATYSYDWIKQEMEAAGVPTCVVCDVVIKPDIVFFGESLPPRFFEYLAKDFYEADLLIVMGSSLVVEPFASLVRRVHRNCPRIIINDHEVGTKVGIMYDPKRNERDVFMLGTCDDGCQRIVDSMGWSEEFAELLKAEEEKFDGITVREDFYPRSSTYTSSSSSKVTVDGRSYNEHVEEETIDEVEPSVYEESSRRESSDKETEDYTGEATTELDEQLQEE